MKIRHPTVSVASPHTDNLIDIDACLQRWMVREEKRHFSAILDSILFFSRVLLESLVKWFKNTITSGMYLIG